MGLSRDNQTICQKQKMLTVNNLARYWRHTGYANGDVPSLIKKKGTDIYMSGVTNTGFTQSF